MSRIVRDVVLRIQIQPPNIAGAVGGGGGRFIAGGGGRAGASSFLGPSVSAAAAVTLPGQAQKTAQGLSNVSNAAKAATRNMSGYANAVGLASLEMARLFTWSRLVTRVTFGIQELGGSRIPGLVAGVGAGLGLVGAAGAVSVGAQFATGQLGIGLPQALGGRGFVQGAEGLTGRVGRAAFGASIGRVLSSIGFTARNPFSEETRQLVGRQGLLRTLFQPLGIGEDPSVAGLFDRVLELGETEAFTRRRRRRARQRPPRQGIVFQGPGGPISIFDQTQAELEEIAEQNLAARQRIEGFRTRRGRVIGLGQQSAQEQLAGQLAPFERQRRQGLLGGIPGAVGLANRSGLIAARGLAGRFAQQRDLGGGVFSLGQQMAAQQQITALIGRQQRDLLQTSREQTQELQRELSVRRQIQQTIEQQISTLEGRRRGALRFAAGAGPGGLAQATRAIRILQEGGRITPAVRQQLLGMRLPPGLQAEFQRRLGDEPRFAEFADLFATEGGILAGRRRGQQVGQAQADTRSTLQIIIDTVRRELIGLERERAESEAREREFGAEGADLARERQLIGIQERGGN